MAPKISAKTAGGWFLLSECIAPQRTQAGGHGAWACAEIGSADAAMRATSKHAFSDEIVETTVCRSV